MPVMPAPQTRGELQFRVAKFLPYGCRMLLVLGLLLAGLVIQLCFSFWWGVPVLLAATLLGAVKGYKAAPEKLQGEEWRQVTPDEYAKVQQREAALAVWDRDAFDITCGRGGCVIVICGVLLFGLATLLATISEALLGFVAVDALVVLLPHWFIGTRSYLSRADLIIKLNALQAIMKLVQPVTAVQVQPMLALATTEAGKKVPCDARLLLRIAGAPDWLLGVQVQVALNNVQGTAYPYLYAVVIAKKEGGLPGRCRPEWLKPRPLDPTKVIFELQGDGDVDVLVVRQYITCISGYHTKPDAAAAVVACALNVTGSMLDQPELQAMLPARVKK